MTTKKQPNEPAEQPEALAELDALKEPEAPAAGDDYNPEADEARAAELATQQQLAEKQAAASAMVTVAVLESAIGMIWPGVKVDKAQKEAVQAKLLPVLVKYNAGGLPPWVAAYREELELMGAVGMVAFTVHMQIKALKAKEVKEAVQHGAQPEPEAA